MNSCSPAARVTVIVPTSASVHRKMQLQLAVASIRESSTRPIRIIAVVNGPHVDPSICEWLKQQSDVHFEYLPTPSAPGAILKGRRLVQTEFFSCLDDDDEYLPGATDAKVAALEAATQADLLVTNAYECMAGVDSLIYPSLIDVPASPLECLMKFNWLHNGNALYRTASVTPLYFEDYHQYLEWTWLAFRLSLDGKKVAVLDIPTFRYNNSAESLSKSEAFTASGVPLFQRMVELRPPAHIVQLIQRKMGSAYHDASDAALHAGNRRLAWRYHWQSLALSGGWKYLTFTKNFLR